VQKQISNINIMYDIWKDCPFKCGELGDSSASADISLETSGKQAAEVHSVSQLTWRPAKRGRGGKREGRKRQAEGGGREERAKARAKARVGRGRN